MKKVISVIVATLFAAFAFSACSTELPPLVIDGKTSSETSSGSTSSSAAEPDAVAYERGSWASDTVYENPSIDIQFTLPEGWLAASEDEIKSMMEAGQAALTEGQQKLAELSKYKTTYDFVAADSVNGTQLQMMAEDLSMSIGGSKVDEEQYLDIVVQQLKQVEAIQYSIGEVFRQTIAGKEFVGMSCDVNDGTLFQTYLTRREGNHMLSFILTYQGAGEASAQDVLKNNLTAVGAAGAEPTSSISDLADKLLKDFKSDGRESGDFYDADMGEELTNTFFSFKVNDAAILPGDDEDEYDILVVNITVKSVFDGDAIPMADTDFEIYWDGQENEDPWAPMAPGIMEGQLPETYELTYGQSTAGDLLYQVPKGMTEFMLYYLEVYEDDFEGNSYGVFFEAQTASLAA